MLLISFQIDISYGLQMWKLVFMFFVFRVVHLYW